MSAAALCFTAHTLDELVRPRYLATAMLGSLACCGAILGVLTRYKNQIFLLPLGLVLGLSTLDGWAFFDAWSIKRVEVTGATPVQWPSPPSLWARQFQNMTDLTLRDLTLWGGVRLAEISSQHPNGMAIPRLRDDRHRSLSGLAEIYGIPHVIVDPGNCCTGRPADLNCAKEVVSQLQLSGFSLIIPTDIKGVQRINRFEKRWKAALLSVVESYETVKEDEYWIILEAPTAQTNERPCQKKAPFRRPK